MKQIFPDNFEFDFISRIFAAQDPKFLNDNKILGIGDDAAVVNNLAISVDTSVEDVHFSLEWGDISQAFEKAVLSNISDINAMGAKASLALLAIGIPKSWSKNKRNNLSDAINLICKKHQLHLIGGDTVASADEKCFFSITIMGVLNHKALLRSNAKVGDKIYISGSLGKSLAGLKLLEMNKLDIFPELIEYHKVPNIPIGLGEQLSKFDNIGACIDISDGLASELKHISIQSNTKMRIYEDKFKYDEILRKYCVHFHNSLCNFYLTSGEEYQLLFTMPESYEIELSSYNIIQIGEVVDGGGVEIVGLDGQVKDINIKTWSHF